MPAAEAESAWDAESGTCLADWRANTWGNETMTLHHWCREHAENMDRPVHYNSVHQHMRFEARILYVANNDWTKERITKVVIELGHQGDGNPVRTWEWTPGKADELELSGAHDFTVLMDKCWKTLGVGAFDGRGRYSATATATIELIKRKDDPKVHRTRTLTATPSRSGMITDSSSGWPMRRRLNCWMPRTVGAASSSSTSALDERFAWLSIAPLERPVVPEV